MTPAFNEYTSLMKQQRFTEAAALADRQTVLEANNSVFWLTKLSNALRERGDTKGALSTAQQACAREPGNSWALLAQAEALLKAKEYQKASASFKDALTNDKILRRARWGILYCTTKLAEWNDVLDLVTRWELPSEEAWSWRAKALLGLKKTDEAAAVCTTWLSTVPDAPEALWIQAELWIQKEGIDAVISRFSRFAKIPGKPPVYGEILATLCKRAGKTDDALKQYGKLLDKSNSPALQRKHAFALSKSGRETEAIPLFEELLRSAPADMYLNAAYIAACKRIKDPEHAWKFYHELAGLHPAEMTLLGRLEKVRKLVEINAQKNADDTPSEKTTP